MTIDGLTATRVLQPGTVEDLSHLLSEEKGSVVPIGGATQTYFGNPLKQFDCAVDLTRLNRITEYVPADLTVHVEAGVRLGDLDHLLRENNQCLPLDPWNGPSATIGGIAATDAQGPFRAIGTIRDWIIGMKVVDASGRISKTGGRVVKNVTGYDLAKLYTGSIGTLAMIVEISLKLRARYARTATAIAPFESIEKTFEVLRQIRTSPLAPVSCEWVGPENEVWVRFGEHPRAVEWQLKHLPAADWRFVEGPEETKAWESLRRRYEVLGPIVVKTIGLPSDTAAIVRMYGPESWIAHTQNGIVLLGFPDADRIGRIRTKFRAVVERAPLEARRTVSTFGLNANERELMLKMKHAFDPGSRLNPGRHVDGELQLQ
jgi:glycolate dehydrogenase FAD-binding subunit